MMVIAGGHCEGCGMCDEKPICPEDLAAMEKNNLITFCLSSDALILVA